MKNEILYNVKEFENLKDMINNACTEFANHTAFVIKHKEGKNVNYENISYKTFGEEVNALGTALIDMGYKDKRIAVIGKNRYEWVTSYTAVINGVGIVVPLDKGLPEDEIEMSIKKSKAEVIFCEANYVEILNKIIDKKETALNKVICMDEIEDLSTMKELIEKGKELIKSGNTEYIKAQIDREKVAAIVFTSGTTSLSKAVMLSHKNIASNINSMSKVEGIFDTDTREFKRIQSNNIYMCSTFNRGNV